MFKKSQGWESGIKIISKFFGFDIDDQQAQNQHNKKNIGLFKFKYDNQTTVARKSQQKSFQLKQKWRKLMKFPAKIKYYQIISLMKQGSALQDEIWLWMFKNTQKISPHLYNMRKQQLHQILYSSRLSNQYIDFNFQGQDFADCKDFPSDLDERKRKISITKNNLYKNQPKPSRMSMHSQASTFTSQSHRSNELLSNKFDEPCRDTSRPQFVRPPFEQTCLPEFQILQELPGKINHPVLTDIIGSLLLQRTDMKYSVTLFNMAATFFYYTNSNEMKSFILINHVAASQFYVHYLENQAQISNKILQEIVARIRLNCPSSAFLKNIRLENFIENWLFGFFFAICENGTQIKQKLIGYLLLHGFSIQSLTKVCESLILSLKKTINKGNQQTICTCLLNPKFYLDRQILLESLFDVKQ